MVMPKRHLTSFWWLFQVTDPLPYPPNKKAALSERAAFFDLFLANWIYLATDLAGIGCNQIIGKPDFGCGRALPFGKRIDREIINQLME